MKHGWFALVAVALLAPVPALAKKPPPYQRPKDTPCRAECKKEVANGSRKCSTDQKCMEKAIIKGMQCYKACDAAAKPEAQPPPMRPR
jgi:hypothetical protein